ncbi:YjfB family protein [Hydrogenophaga soli]
MDVSTQGLVQVATAMADAQTSQAIQVSVLKKALNAEASGALALLQALPTTGELPLATEGNLGTQVNVLA